LTKEIKDYDLKAVRSYPEILAKAGLEVYRKPQKKTSPRRKDKR
jgi:hypothetical protein